MGHPEISERMKSSSLMHPSAGTSFISLSWRYPKWDKSRGHTGLREAGGCCYLWRGAAVVTLLHSHLIDRSISAAPHLPDALELLPPVPGLPAWSLGLRDPPLGTIPLPTLVGDGDTLPPPAAPREGSCAVGLARCKRRERQPGLRPAGRSLFSQQSPAPASHANGHPERP